MTAMTVARRYEIDMGHMLPTHLGKCFNAHGHRYVIEVVVSTEGATSRPGETDDGMVADFADIKRIMSSVLDEWDHGFVVSLSDPDYPSMASMTNRNVIAVPFIPTAENLAVAWGEEIADELSNHQLVLERIIVHETPNARAVYEPTQW